MKVSTQQSFSVYRKCVQRLYSVVEKDCRSGKKEK